MTFLDIVFEGFLVTAFSGELAGHSGSCLIRFGTRLDLAAEISYLISRLETLLVHDLYIMVSKLALHDLFFSDLAVETKFGKFFYHLVGGKIAEIAAFFL